MKRNFIAAFPFIALSLCQSPTPAPEVSDNAPGVSYLAELQAGPGSIQGSIIGTSAPDGKGVNFAISFENFPESDETTYTYHIHAKPVAADGNCSSTGPHLDTYHAGAASSSPTTYKCNPDEPALCELGDLAGKHGKMEVVSGGSYSGSYVDVFLSTTDGSPAFFGNLSVVLHRASDNARLRCGNFALIDDRDSIPPPSNDCPSSSSSKPTETAWESWSPTEVTQSSKPTETGWESWSSTDVADSSTPAETGWESWSPTGVAQSSTETKVAPSTTDIYVPSSTSIPATPVATFTGAAGRIDVGLVGLTGVILVWIL